MYSFADRGGREITLRPEFTAGVLRAVLEHNLHKGALPGEGLHQRRPRSATSARRRAGTGSSTSSTWRRSAPRTRRSTPRRSPSRYDAYRSLGLTQFTLLLNSLGRQELPPRLPRPRCRSSCARSTWTRRPGSGSRSTRCGCSTTSAPRCARRPANAPYIVDYLCGDCKAHHDTVRALLASLGIPFERRAAPGPRPRLLHADHVRVRPRAARRAVGHRRRRPLRRPVARTSAARRCPASASRSAWTV